MERVYYSAGRWDVRDALPVRAARACRREIVPLTWRRLGSAPRPALLGRESARACVLTTVSCYRPVCVRRELLAARVCIRGK
ncbi:hypothetical protein GCM10017687_90690 [Streptomyces echinatus]